MYSLKLFLIGIDQETLPLLQREFLNRWATIHCEFPDVSSATRSIVLLDNEPCLFVVRVPSSNDLSEIKKLNEKFPKKSILALLDYSVNSSLVIQAVRNGATQVVTLPLRAEDLTQAIDCISSQFDAQKTQASTIAISGTMGGSGVTTIALNLASEIARLKGMRCILVECSLRMGVLTSYLDVQPAYSTNDLIARVNRLDNYLVEQSLTKVAENFFLLPGPFNAIDHEVFQASDVLALIDVIRQLGGVVVLDVPASYDDLYFHSLSLSDQSVIVVEQKVASIRGAQLACTRIDSLRRPHFVINRYDPTAGGLSVESVSKFLNSDQISTIANDESMLSATNYGRLLRAQNPRSAALLDVDSLIDRLFPSPRNDETDTSDGKSTLLNRLSRALCLS